MHLEIFHWSYFEEAEKMEVPAQSSEFHVDKPWAVCEQHTKVRHHIHGDWKEGTYVEEMSKLLSLLRTCKHLIVKMIYH